MALTSKHISGVILTQNSVVLDIGAGSLKEQVQFKKESFDRVFTNLSLASSNSEAKQHNLRILREVGKEVKGISRIITTTDE